MADRSSTLKLIFAGDNKGAIRSIDQIGGEFGKVEGKARGIGSGLAAAGLSTGAVVLGVGKAVDAFESGALQVGKIERLTGQTAQQASLLRFAAQQSGVPFDKLATSTGIFASNITKGKVEAAGIATRDSNGRLLSFNEILRNTADHLHSLPAGYQRTAAARDLFGRGGADIEKILQGGSAAMDDQATKMRKLGQEYDQSGVDKAKKLVHAQRDLSSAVKGAESQIGKSAAPALAALEEGGAKVLETFIALPGPIKTGIVLLGGVGAAGLAAATAVGAIQPVLKTGIGILTGHSKAATDAAVSTEGLGEAEAQLALEADAAAAASAAFNDTIRAGGTIEEAATAATEARTEALAAETVATDDAATASVGLGAALGIATAAAVVGVGAYKELTATHKTFAGTDVAAAAGFLEQSDALKATNAQLVRNAQLIESNGGGVRGFIKYGKDNIDVLYATRDALKAAHRPTTDLDAAITSVEHSNKRAADREREYAGATDGATGATKRQADAAKVAATELQGQYDKAKQLVDLEAGAADAALAAFDASSSLQSAKQRTNDAAAKLAWDRAAHADAKTIRQDELDLASAMKDQAQDAGSLAEANAKVAGKTLDASAKATIMRDALIKVRAQTGFWNDDLGTLADQLAKVELQAKAAADQIIALEKIRETLAYEAYHHGQAPPEGPGQGEIPGRPQGPPHAPGSPGKVPDQAKPQKSALIHVENMHVGDSTRDLQMAMREAERRQAQLALTGSPR